MAMSVLRGVPVDRYSRKETIIAYWGFGVYWGKAVSQNKKGHLIGHIKVYIMVLWRLHSCVKVGKLVLCALHLLVCQVGNLVLCALHLLLCLSGWSHQGQASSVLLPDMYSRKPDMSCKVVPLLQDLNHDPCNPDTRLYATHAAQPYHNDASDIVGKLLLNLLTRLNRSFCNVSPFGQYLELVLPRWRCNNGITILQNFSSKFLCTSALGPPDVWNQISAECCICMCNPSTSDTASYSADAQTAER